MKNKFYVQLNANSLPHYIVSGCIRPVCLIERREHDIQSVYNDFLLLSTRKWSSESDCSIEIILTDLEFGLLKELNSDYFLYPSLFPLSRIVKIFFLSKEKSDDIIWNIESGAGFVPDKWIFYEDKLESELSINEVLKIDGFENDINRLTQSYAKFNRLLGGFAFFKSALYDLNDSRLNYPVNYFASLGFYNDFLNQKSKELGLSLPFYISNILSNDNAISKYIGREIALELLEKSAINEGFILEMKFGNFPFDSIPNDSLVFKLGVLYTYGKSKSKSVEDLIGGLFEKLDYNKREEMALLFGLNTGYEGLRNYYKLNNRNVNIKFDFESTLDFYIVETIFQHSINQLKSNDFEFILKNAGALTKIELVPDEYLSYNIFDTLFITKRKDYIESLEQIIEEIINSLLSWFPNGIFKLNTERLRNFFMLRVKHLFSKSVDQIKNDVKIRLNNEISEKTRSKKVKISEINNSKINDTKEAIVGPIIAENTILDNSGASSLLNKEDNANSDTVKNIATNIQSEINELESEKYSSQSVDKAQDTEYDVRESEYVNEYSQIDIKSREIELAEMNLGNLRKLADNHRIKWHKSDKEREIIYKILDFESTNPKFL